MAPITDETVQNLRDLVNKLETRVHQLESKLEGSSGKARNVQSMRMILIGPPGAGMKRFRVEGLAADGGAS